jgi:ABC-type nitrate/sulfonate/bicarbonate transport system permease component
VTHRMRTVGQAWAVPVALLGLYWAWSTGADSFYFPPLHDIAGAFTDLWLFERFASDVIPSLWRIAAGYGLSVTLGVGIGVVLGRSRLGRAASEPILHFFRALPAVVLIPFALLVFGPGEPMKVFIIVSGAIWPILLNTIDGVRSVDPILLDLSRAYNVPRRARMLRVLLPYASPAIFAGLRTSLSISIILMVISEMVASTNGVGYFVRQAERTYAIPEMWSGIVLLGLLGYFANVLFIVAERRILRWHYGARGLLIADEPEAEPSETRDVAVEEGAGA